MDRLINDSSFEDFKKYIIDVLQIHLINLNGKLNIDDDDYNFSLRDGIDIIGEIQYNEFSLLPELDKILEFFAPNLSIFKYNRIRLIIKNEVLDTYGCGKAYKSWCTLRDLFAAMKRESISLVVK